MLVLTMPASVTPSGLRCWSGVDPANPSRLRLMRLIVQEVNHAETGPKCKRIVMGELAVAVPGNCLQNIAPGVLVTGLTVVAEKSTARPCSSR